jgi:hypothetical protein
MEIGTYLRGLLHRWWVILLVVLLAGSGAFVLVGGATNIYNASVNITVPPSLAATVGANGQYVSNFKVALTSTDVLAKVTDATGLSAHDASSRLSASQIGTSSFIKVTFAGVNADRSKTAVQVATEATAELLAKGAVETANTEVSAAQSAVNDATTKQDSAQQAVTSYTSAHGFVDPNVLYQSTQSSLTQLNVSKQQAIAAGHDTSTFDIAIASAQSQLSTLAKEVSDFNVLDHALTVAESAVSAAQTRLSTASQDLAIAKAPPLIDDPTQSTTTGRSTTIKGVAIGAGIGLVLGIAIVLLIEFISASRRERADAAAVLLDL